MEAFSFIKNGEEYTNQDVIDIINDGQCDFVYRLDWLKDLEDPFEAADEIAEAIKDAYGVIIFESEYYYCQHVIATIMDLLSDPEPFSIDPVVAWILLRSFEKADFKYAENCEMSEWRNIYAQTGYAPYAISTQYKSKYDGYEYDTYEYDQIQKNNETLNHELLYHPRFIEKWITEGNDLEDYLM